MAKRKKKKPTITVTRVSDGDVKEVLKSEVVKYNKQGYKAEWTVTQEVKAPVKDLTKEKKEDDTKEG